MKCLVIVTPFMEPYRPPISGAIICETAKQAGYEVNALDLNIELYHYVGEKKFHELELDYGYKKDYKWNEFDTFINKMLTKEYLNEHEYILISGFTFLSFDIITQICQFIKQHTNSKIVIGGPVTSFPMNEPMLGLYTNEHAKQTHTFGEYLKQRELVDHFIVSEGEIALKELLNGNTDYPGIDGKLPKQIDDLDSLPLPNYDKFDLDRYEYLEKDKEFFIYGSRGCVRKCTFCDVPSLWPKFRYRSGESLAQEMIMYYEKYGVTNFHFVDSLFNGSLKNFYSFLEALAKYNQNKLFRWGGMAIVRPKNQHPPEMYDMIAASSNNFWIVGVETFVDRIRMETQKKFTNDDLLYHLEQSSRIGLENIFLMMPTWLTETKEEHQQYVDFFPKLKKYMANGSLTGISMSPRLMMYDTVPAMKIHDLTFKHDMLDSLSLAKPYYWYNKENADLNLKERITRALNVFEAAKNNYMTPLLADQVLIDLEKFADLLVEHPEMEFKQ